MVDRMVSGTPSGVPGTAGAVAKPGRPASGVVPAPAPDSTIFRTVVRSRLAGARQAEPVKWSRHAHQRLLHSGRTLRPGEEAAIGRAVDRAAGRGGRDSLVLLSDLALVVNVPNRTVVTAATRDRLHDGVFTQIDSAVIVSADEGAQEEEPTGAGPLWRKLPIPPNDGSGIHSGGR